MKIEVILKGEIKDDSFSKLNANIDSLLTNWIWFKKDIKFEEMKQK